MKNYTQHPLSSAWPAMSESDFQSLKDSIEALGVLHPIVIFEDQVIDGWHRYTASSELGMPYPTVELDDTDPVDFVKAMNESRRHLTDSQRAIAIVSIYGWKPSHRPGNKVEPGSCLTKTNAELAKEAGVSVKTIQQAKDAKRAGLDEDVKDGKLTVKAASRVAKGQSATPEKKGQSSAPQEPAHPKESETDNSAADAPDATEVRANQLAQEADLAALQMLLDADDKLATAHAEIKKLNAEVAHLKVNRDGYMRQLDEYKKITAKVQRENDRLRKPNR